MFVCATPHLKRVVAVGAVIEVLRLDDIDDRHENARRLLLDSLHQRLQPVDDALAVRVEEDESVGLGETCAGQTGSDQPKSEKREN